MLELGMSLPGLHERATALAALPSLGVLTLAGMTPPDWTVSYRDPARVDDDLVAALVDERPTLVAISALTATTQTPPSSPGCGRSYVLEAADGRRRFRAGVVRLLSPRGAASATLLSTFSRR